MSPAELRAAAGRVKRRKLIPRVSGSQMDADLSALADAARRLAAIQEAWTIPGRMPPYHAYMQELVRRDWPTLAQAIERSLK